jgi:hypothetical protein
MKKIRKKIGESNYSAKESDLDLAKSLGCKMKRTMWSAVRVNLVRKSIGISTSLLPSKKQKKNKSSNAKRNGNNLLVLPAKRKSSKS